MLSLANIYTLYFRLYFRLCICLNKLSINQSIDYYYYYYMFGFYKMINNDILSKYECLIREKLR